MMKNTNTLVIFGHPDPNSFNGAILKTVENKLIDKKYQFIFKNLYQLNFNPVLTSDDLKKTKNSSVASDIAIEQNDIEWAKNIIFIYPIWWAGQPAMVKGWIDRVLTPGFAYAFQEDGTIKGLLSDKVVMVFTTTRSGEENTTESGMAAAIEKTVMEGIFGFCGINTMLYKNLYGVSKATEAEKKEMLAEVEYLLNAI
ncbi:MAG: NAD(P)H-dependent oxidoreductase [Clostridiales bacterium]|nr:NAD(P)H-dependent oxidoreductase [Clostridiales bacterium]